MNITTGFGYYEKNGKKLHKYDLPKGEHPDPIGYTVVEVKDQAALDQIVLDISDEYQAILNRAAVVAQNKKTAILKLKGLGLNDDEIAAITGN